MQACAGGALTRDASARLCLAHCAFCCDAGVTMVLRIYVSN